MQVDQKPMYIIIISNAPCIYKAHAIHVCTTQSSEGCGAWRVTRVSAVPSMAEMFSKFKVSWLASWLACVMFGCVLWCVYKSVRVQYVLDIMKTNTLTVSTRIPTASTFFLQLLPE